MSEDVGQGTSDPQGTYLTEGEEWQMCGPNNGSQCHQSHGLSLNPGRRSLGWCGGPRRVSGGKVTQAEVDGHEG